MKKVLTIVLAMFCLASCEKSTQKNDLAELKLNGKVKSIREIPYEAVEKFYTYSWDAKQNVYSRLGEIRQEKFVRNKFLVRILLGAYPTALLVIIRANL